MNRLKQLKTTDSLGIIEWVIILATPAIPLLFTFPYRINLFLAWEGAFRLSLGEVPYRDFGTPVGYVFWILPAIFFKILGPSVITLLKVQAFINIISNYLFSRIFRQLKLEVGARVVALSIFVLSYSLFNFWPWYNHFVFVLEMASLLFALKLLGENENKRIVLYCFLSAGFAALAFMTKQDTGGFALLFSGAIILFDSIKRKKPVSVLTFIGAYLFWMILLIAPFLMYDFTYWFNYGQTPHFSRLTFFDLLDEFLGASKWIKFYLVLIIVILYYRLNNNWKTFFKTEIFVPFFIGLFILFQASVIQVTSYTPLDGNIYFHSFIFGVVLLQFDSRIVFHKGWSFFIVICLVGLWWTNVFWVRNIRPKVKSYFQITEVDVVSKNTYVLDNDTSKMKRSNWVVPKFETFKGVKIPEETIEGINKILEMPIVQRSKNDLQVLNMSELTQLAYEIPYDTEKGIDHPLWYHQGVAFFDREVQHFCSKVENKNYDLILFQDIPDLNNFYSYEVRDCILKNYELKFKFLAPRIPEESYIEVYTRRKTQ
ncbi:hypothetical protein [uncultured Marivirga sp.]|uniref:hypothetical protein n=1 Tax=uncultured Marivirga sp. TaxID=1123707 RepID=UPI0030EB249E|tara:strand:- start:19491 stop:21113 length:1623 start_codon:yes stop_codon:yes gene_type:complete